MKDIPLTSEQFLAKLSVILNNGFFPYQNSGMGMKFTKGGKIHDLSAADLTKLAEIEENGLFVVA